MKPTILIAILTGLLLTPLGFIPGMVDLDGRDRINCIPETQFEEYSLWRLGCHIKLWAITESSQHKEARLIKEARCQVEYKEYLKTAKTFATMDIFTCF